MPVAATLSAEIEAARRAHPLWALLPVAAEPTHGAARWLLEREGEPTGE